MSCLKHLFLAFSPRIFIAGFGEDLVLVVKYVVAAFVRGARIVGGPCAVFMVWVTCYLLTMVVLVGWLGVSETLITNIIAVVFGGGLAAFFGFFLFEPISTKTKGEERTREARRECKAR